MNEEYYVNLHYITRDGSSYHHSLKMPSKEALDEWSLDEWLMRRISLYGEMLPCGDDEAIKLSTVIRLGVDRNIPF